MLTGGSAGLISSAMGMGVVGIILGVYLLRTGGGDGCFAILVGAVAILGGSLFLALSKTWQASTPESAEPGDSKPYDGPASISPRNNAYMRMIDPRQERPRDY